jgi:hypothetical protein
MYAVTAYDRRAHVQRWAMAAHARCTTRSQHAVVAYLAGVGLSHDRITPPQSLIAERTGLGLRTVNRAIAVLTRLGLWDKFTDRPRRRADGTWYRERTNWYRLSWRFRRVTPGRTDTPSPAYLCDSEAIEPERRRPQAAPTPSNDAPTLFEDPDPPPEPAERTETRPWVLEGISRDEWIRRQTSPAS